MVPPITRSPGCFSTGIDSPVSIDSSTALAPERTSPSTGTRSPGRTSTVSPFATCSTGTSTSASPRSTGAVLGPRLQGIAGEDQGDDDHHRLVVDVRPHAPREEEPGGHGGEHRIEER